MSKEIKIGLVARCDNSGLGTLARDFYNNLPVEKSLLVLSRYQNDTSLFRNSIISERGVPTLEEVDRFLEGLDVVIGFETVYNWSIFSKAKERGIKTILIPMYEWTPEPLPVIPDLIICPSKLDYDYYKQDYPKANVEYLPIPIDRKVFKFKKKKTATTFLFNNGHGGFLERNSLTELLQAISLIPLDAKFIINTQIPPAWGIKDRRITLNIGEMTREELFKEGDVFIMPHKFNGLSLPIQEAMSCGMPVISTDIYPTNDYLPKEWLFEPEAMVKGRLGANTRYIDIALISPKKLAKAIEKWINQDISKYSEMMDKKAEEMSWKTLKPKYLNLIKKICQK